MKYQLLMEKGEYALILRGSRMEEYAVVSGLNKVKGEWAWTCCYYSFGSFTQLTQAEALAKAVDYFRMRTEEKYISRVRLEKLATKFKDGLFGADLENEEYEEFFNEECEMEDYEKEFFGI